MADTETDANPEAGWVRPFCLEQKVEASWTVVGNVGSPAQAIVDPRGLVAAQTTGRDRAWSVDWWIGAEDRWHLPSRETGVRQRLLANSPVVETAMRIPGGDVVQRVYAVSGARDLVVIEVENQTPTPVALALAVRPFHLDRAGRIRRLRLDGATVAVEDEPALFLPRRPARIAASSGAEGDSARRVFDGTDDPGADVDVACAAGRAQAVFVYPLAHGATLRAAVVLSHGAVVADAPPIDALPNATDVARGWAAHTRRGLRLELPSGSLADAVEASRRFLLLLPNAGGDRSTHAALGRALRAYGFEREADELRGRRDRWLPSWLRRPEPPSPDSDHVWPRLQEMLRTASATWTWPPGHDAPATAELLFLVRQLLIDETDDGLAVLPVLPDAWRGQPIEVHDAPTDYGSFSFAVRWHGEHPALLWELDARHRSPVRITAPGLNPDWSTNEPRGEALLATARMT